MFGDFFGAYLLDLGAITGEQLEEAVRIQRENNILLGTLAVQRGYMDGFQLVELLEEQHKLDRKLGELAVEKGYMNDEQRQELIDIQSAKYLTLGESLVKLGFLSRESMLQHLKAWHESAGKQEEKARAQLEEFPYHDLLLAALEQTRLSFFRRGYPARVLEITSSIPPLEELRVFVASQHSKDDQIHYYALLLPDRLTGLLGSFGLPDPMEAPDATREDLYESLLQWVFLLNYSICRSVKKKGGPGLKHGPVQSTLPDYSECMSARLNTLVAPFYMLYLTP
jgi:hypothetical protein